MLKAKNWARWLYIGSAIIGIIVSMAYHGLTQMNMFSLLFPVVPCVLLLSKPSNQYFSSESVIKISDYFVKLALAGLFIVLICCAAFFMLIYFLDNNPGFHT